MKRRNLMIGLGILATGSGAATLSGAALSNTVSPTADFRINVEGGLVVRAGSSFPDTTNTTDSNVGPDDADYILSNSFDSSVFDELNDKTSVAAVADSEENEELHIGLAFPYSSIENSTSASFEFPDLLEVQNNNNAPVDVAVAYQDGDSSSISDTTDSAHGFETNIGTPAVSETGNGSDQLSFDQVASMFQFTDGQGNTISPTGADDQTNSNQAVTQGLTVSGTGAVGQLSLTVDVSSTMAGIIDQYVNDVGLTTNGGSVPLVDAIWVGEYS